MSLHRILEIFGVNYLITVAGQTYKITFCFTFLMIFPFQGYVECSRSQMLFKIGVLKISQISQENTCVEVTFE